MLLRLFLTVITLLCSAVLVNGQCTLSSCTKSASASVENIVTVVEEHDDKLQSMYKNISSAFEQLARYLEENDQNMKRIDQRLSSIFEKIEQRLGKDLKEQNERQCQQTMSNISAEDLERRFEIGIHDQLVRLAYQNVSAQIDEKLNRHLKIIQQTLSNISTEDCAHSPLPANDRIIAQVMEHDRRLQVMKENFTSAIEKVTVSLNAVLDHVNANINISKSQEYCAGASVLCDCSTIKANGYTASGMYRIYVKYPNQRYYANTYCDMTTSNGAWTIIQRRKDGSVDFFRGWNDYANGFGNPNGDFWLGNNFIRYLSSSKRYRLRIDLEDFDGQKRYAEYSTFNISSEADKYRLSIGTYSGNAGDSLGYHKGKPFTTKDVDNDNRPSGNCAEERRGGWWYGNCHYANLNGMYKRGRYSTTNCTYCGIEWTYWRGDYYSLKTTEMKITPVA